MGTKRKEINFTNQELSDYIERRIFMPELATKYGVNKDTVRLRLRDLNRDDINATIDLNRAQSNTKMTDSVFQCVLDDYNSNMSMEDISDKYHMTPVTINTHLRNRGIPTRKRPESKRPRRDAKPRFVFNADIPKTIFVKYQKMFTQSMMQL